DKVSLKTGCITFRDSTGNIILREETDGRTFTAATMDSRPFYHIRQVFKSPPDEVFYGMAQHQKHFLNLKDHDITLLQYNTQEAVPFLVSSRNYGILWDNYSLTRFGDPHPYKEISGLKLYDAQGNPGGLTTTYMAKDDT